MRRAVVLMFLVACSSGNTAPGMPGATPYPGMPGAPVAPGYPGAVPGYPGMPGQPGVAMPQMPQMPQQMPPGYPQGYPPVVPVMPAGQPMLAPAAMPMAMPPGFRQIAGVGFTFAVPQTWIDIPPPMPQVVVAARDTTQLGSLFPNANLVTEAFPMGDGQAYANANLTGLGQSATILGQRPSSTGGRNGADIEARWPNGPAGQPYRTLQRLTAANGRGYVLTCTADDVYFEQARATCNAVLESFRVMP